MVRISDARMSGTAYGTVILHVAPESAAGGPLALVKTGDEIALDGPNRKLDLLVDQAELDLRRAAWEAARQAPAYTRGWYKLYIDTVLQADRGVDLDFLVGKSSPDVTRESH
jgi:dihydroxy-acid dehydratase